MILIGPKICLNLEKKLIEKQSKIIEHLRLQKNFFFIVYKMVDISAETWIMA